MQRLEVSCAVRPIYRSLGAKALILYEVKNSILCGDHKPFSVCDLISATEPFVNLMKISTVTVILKGVNEICSYCPNFFCLI
jgi:hypothetical protein